MLQQFAVFTDQYVCIMGVWMSEVSTLQSLAARLQSLRYHWFQSKLAGHMCCQIQHHSHGVKLSSGGSHLESSFTIELTDCVCCTVCWSVLQACEASVQQQEALGPLLSQVSKLSTSQLHLWQYIQQYAGDAELGESSGLEEQSAATGIRAAAVTAAALQQLKQSFEAAGVLQNWDGCSPLCVMLLKVLQQQQCPSQQPDMQQQQRQQHVEALAMLHVVSVLLHGVIYEHALDISRQVVSTCHVHSA